MKPGNNSIYSGSVVRGWCDCIGPVCDTLRKLAGTTEHEFLQIGVQLQDCYHRSTKITEMANRLVELVSGSRSSEVIDQLHSMIAEIEAYLAGARRQNSESSAALESILGLFDRISRPLESFQKMTKTLRMLGVSTKIESSRMGDEGLGFLTLAQDVEKLAQLVSEKSAAILGHSRLLEGMISENLRLVRMNDALQEREVAGVLASTAASLDEMIAVNGRCSSFGTLVSSVSAGVSADVSEVVASMQMHDMTRQQVEHIIEALERLGTRLANEPGSEAGDDQLQQLVVEAGDVCELQSAQLRHAADELCSAVCSIADNLRDVAGRQSLLASESLATAGAGDRSGGSFMEKMTRGMTTVTTVLAECARSDRNMTHTLARAAETMREVAGYVADIQGIGTEIDLIALNAQIKAAHTGREGAALGVLAEAIKRLSVESISQTETVAASLLEIDRFTTALFQDTSRETEHLGGRVSELERVMGGIMTALGSMNSELADLLGALVAHVNELGSDVEQTVSAIDVQLRVRDMAMAVNSELDSIVSRSRELEPASQEFMNNLRHMEERYTMESERRIHEAIARKRSGGTADPEVPAREGSTVASDSEFGDNVDLF